MTDGSVVERCHDHRCCLVARDLQASPGAAHLAGTWHLQWMSDDSAWFLVPPQGNVREVRVLGEADPVGELTIDVVGFDDARAEIARSGLFPPC
jgi:hypothetical protein